MSSWDPGQFDPHAREFLNNPYPTYARFRDTAPVSFVAAYDAYWVFTYHDVETVVEDSGRFAKNRPADVPPHPTPPPFGVRDGMPKGIFSADPPEHTAIRDVLQPLFADSIHDAADVAASNARDLLRSAKVSARFDLYSAFALPLPPRVLFTALGLPAGDWAGVEQWVSTIVAGNDPTQPLRVQAAAGTCAFALLAYFQALTAQCPHLGGAERLTCRAAAATADPGNMFSLDQALASLQNVTIAGYLSTSFLIATGVYNLLGHPDELSKLRADPELAVGAVHEMLRFDAPAQLVDRYAVETTTLGGVTIPKGAKVTGVLGSANRDASVFPEPDRLDITRDNSRQIAFGEADHRCLGEPLVNIVAPCAFRALINELPYFELAGIVQWQTDPYLRSVVSLPIAIE